MKVKIGRYCLYKDEEYKLGYRGDYSHYIISEDSSKLSEGFYKSYNGKYIKDIKDSEIQQVYAYKPYVIYKGEELGLVRENDETYHVAGSREQCAKVGLKMVEKGCYEMDVPKNEVTVVANKEILPKWLW